MEDDGLLVVADDITGATDTGARIARRGLETRVVTDVRRRPDCDVLVVDTDSRHLDADQAYQRVVTACRDGDDATVYKKIDSTLRGNVRSEIAAVIDATGPDIVVVAPAFPDANRTTIDGSQHVDGTPVHTTEFGGDGPHAPNTSHLPSIVSTLSDDIRSLGIDDVQGSVADRCSRFESRTEGSEPTIVVCDATEESHLETIGRAASRTDQTVAYVGSGGLIPYVGGDTPRDGGIALAVVGSVSEMALSQLRSLPDRRVISLSPPVLLSDTASSDERIASELANCARQGEFVVVTGATSNEDVQRTIEAGRNEGLADDEIERRVTETLAQTVPHFNQSHAISSLFVTGGATYRAILDAVGASSLASTGIELETGVPLAVVEDGPMAGTPVVSKAGGFGDVDTIVKCLDFLCHR